MRKFLLVIATVVLCGSHGAAYAQNYRAEIIREAVDPCYLAILARQGSIPGVSTSEALVLLKMMQQQETEEMIGVLLPIVRGKSGSQRTMLYRFGLQICVNAGK